MASPVKRPDWVNAELPKVVVFPYVLETSLAVMVSDLAVMFAATPVG